MMTFEKALEIGNRWQKNGMDRIYINLTQEIMDSESSEGVRVGNYFNRFELQRVKAYWDVNLDKFVVTHGSDSAKKVLEEALCKN